jgi:hypothetical protein
MAMKMIELCGDNPNHWKDVLETSQQTRKTWMGHNVEMV